MIRDSARKLATSAEREPGQPTRGPEPVRPATSGDRLASVVSRIGSSNADALLGYDAQTTLPMSRRGDHDEREADSVADDITASPGPDPTTTPTFDGGPLPASARRFFEARLGADLSAVRVHHGERAHRAASAVGARAYTAGSDVTFADGQYAPDRPQSRLPQLVGIFRGSAERLCW